jgi:hypothetical protein
MLASLAIDFSIIGMRSPKQLRIITDLSVCDSANILTNQHINTWAMADAGLGEYCPYVEPCMAGSRETRGVNCTALMGQMVVKNALTHGKSITGEMQLLKSEFPTILEGRIWGFVDPFEDPAQVVTDESQILSGVEGWARRIAGVGRAEEVDYLSDDEVETVLPNGVPERVPRDVCRCPVLRVGDFCPVHGG